MSIACCVSEAVSSSWVQQSSEPQDRPSGADANRSGPSLGRAFFYSRLLWLTFHSPLTTASLRQAWEMHEMRAGWGHIGCHQRQIEACSAFRSKRTEVSLLWLALFVVFCWVAGWYLWKAWTCKEGWLQAESQLCVVLGKRLVGSNGLPHSPEEGDTKWAMDLEIWLMFLNESLFQTRSSLMGIVNVWFTSCSHREGAKQAWASKGEYEKERGEAGRGWIFGNKLKSFI